MNHIKFALRSIWNHRYLSLVNVAGLSAGLCCFTIALLYFNHETSYDRWHPQLNNVYRITLVQEGGFGSGSTPAPLAPLLKERGPNIVAFTRLQNAGDFEVLLSTQKKKLYQQGLVMCDSGFLDVFPYTMTIGDAHTALDAPSSVIVSETLSKKLFDNENPVGKVITLFNTFRCTVKGVFALPNTPSHIEPSLVVHDPSMIQNMSWENYSYTTYIRTRYNLTTAQVDASANRIFLAERASDLKNSPTKPRLIADAVPSIHNFPRQGDSQFNTVLVLLILSSLLLLSAAINYSNLALARSLKSTKDVAVRKILGSSTRQIVAQALIETAVLCLFSTVFALVMLSMFLPIFNSYFGLSLSLFNPNNINIWIQLLAAVTLLIVVAGSYPAVISSRFKAATSLKGNYSTGITGRRFSNSLLVVQFAVSVLFILSVIVMAWQMRYLRTRDAGFNGEHVVKVEATQSTREKNFERTRKMLLGIRGIEYVSKSTAIPGLKYIDTSTRQFSYNGSVYPLNSVRISADFFRTLSISATQGRLFSYGYPQDQNNTAIINESARRLLNTESPVGDQIRFPFCDSFPYEIVGVVKDFTIQGFEHTVKPTIYSISNENCGYQSGGALLLKINSSDVQGTLAALTKAWTTVEPEFPIRYAFLDQQFEQLFATHSLRQAVIMIFSGISIVISLLGLFSLTSFIVEKRTKEIAIRKVLGASVVSLFQLISKQFTVLVVLSIFIGLPAAMFLMNKWLEHFAYRITLHWWMPVATAAAVIIIAVMTVGSKAISTAMANPVRHLRNE